MNDNLKDRSFPNFITNKPSGKDFYSGKSQEKLANTIADYIHNHNQGNKLIGLEGGWGIGKSNVIKLLDKSLRNKNKEYYIFLFDAWGNQEDLTRRSILEQLIAELQSKGWLKKIKWKEKKDELLAKSSFKTTKYFPKVSAFFISILIAILLFNFLKIFYNDIWEPVNIIGTNWVGIIIEKFLVIYTIPLLILIVYVRPRMQEEYKAIEQDMENRGEFDDNKNFKLFNVVTLNWNVLGRLFYIFQGKNVESKINENVIEEEPTVIQFRKYFEDIESDIGANNNLIIVFDNIDRLESHKVKALWSSIHTFFAEPKKPYKSWVIVPYASKELKEHFKETPTRGSGFIEKTFSINFRVPPPVLSNWEEVFLNYLELTFGHEIIPVSEIDYLKKTFKSLNKTSIISPRQIINYINKIAAIYLLRRDEIDNQDIKFRYIGLFVLAIELEDIKCHKTTSSFRDEPNAIILNRNYLGTAKGLFNDWNELDQTISALFFGVEIDKADEILLEREVELAIINGDKPRIKALLENKNFNSYFHIVNGGLGINEKYLNLYVILNMGGDKIQNIQEVWIDYANNILTSEYNRHLEEYHKEIIKNVNTELQINLLQKLINNSWNSNYKDKSTQEIYIQLLTEVFDFILEGNINVDLNKIIKERLVYPRTVLNLVQNVGLRYEQYNIITSSEDLESIYFEEDVFNFEQLQHDIDELHILKEHYELNSIKGELKLDISGFNFNSFKKFKEYFNVYQKLFEPTYKLNLDNSMYANLTLTLLRKDDDYLYILCIGISNYSDAIKNNNFKNSLNSLTAEYIRNLSNIILDFINYQDLIKIVNENSTTAGKLKEVIWILAKSHKGRQLNINYVLNNLDAINNNILNNDNLLLKSFIHDINRWHEHYSTNKIKIKDISNSVLSCFQYSELKVIKSIIADSEKFIKSVTKDEWFESIRLESKPYQIITSLLKNDLLSGLPIEYKAAFGDYLEDFIKSGKVPDDKESDYIKQVLNAYGNKTSIFVSLRDKILAKENNIEELAYWTPFIIKHGRIDNQRRADLILDKIVIPIIENEELFEQIFLRKEYSSKLIANINNSKIHMDRAIEELKIQISKDKFKNNSEFQKINKYVNKMSRSN